ncbi:MAG: hypothetical protein WCJ60_04440 [bacterium]
MRYPKLDTSAGLPDRPTDYLPRKKTPLSLQDNKTSALRRRFIRLPLALVIVSTLVVVKLAVPLSVFAFGAGTAYDLSYETTENIFTTGDGACPTPDYHNTDWRNFIFATNANWHNTTNYTSYKTAFDTAVVSGSWAISQVSQQVGSVMISYWNLDYSTSNDAYIVWGTDSVALHKGSTQLYHIEVYSEKYMQGSGTCNGMVQGTSRQDEQYISKDHTILTGSQDLYQNVLMAGTYLNTYPTGYLGLLLKTIIVPDSLLYISENLNVSGLNLVTQYLNNIPITTNPEIRWSISKQQDGGGYPQIYTTDLTLAEPLGYTFPSTGHYAISWNLIPDTPQVIDAHTRFTGGYIKLEVTGDNFVLNNLTCAGSVDGGCEESSPYQDCVSFTSDITGALGCHLANLVIRIKTLLLFLTIPNHNDIKFAFTHFQETLQTHLGFLTYPFTYLYDFFTAFGDTSNNWCTTSSCSKSFGNFFGSPFTINVIQLKTTIPALYDYGVLAIRSLTVFELVILLRRKFVGVLSK